MSTWTKFATAYYKKQHKKNPDYKFKDALKDAAKLYKKKGGGEDGNESKDGTETENETKGKVMDVDRADNKKEEPLSDTERKILGYTEYVKSETYKLRNETNSPNKTGGKRYSKKNKSVKKQSKKTQGGKKKSRKTCSKK